MSDEDDSLELDDAAADAAAAQDDSSVEVTFTEDEFADLYAERTSISAPTRCEFLTGAAGSGKSYEILRRIEEDAAYAILSASTGIAAVNLNATTIHSLLGFFDTDSLRDAYLHGSAERKLRELVTDGYRNVVLDEISMVSHDTLDILVKVFDAVNDSIKQTQHPIGLILVGDFCQLPPIVDRVPGKRAKVASPWAFDAVSWHRFAENTVRLTKNWRQTETDNSSSTKFIAALNHARAGKGAAAVAELVSAGLEFATFVDMEFDGTTLLSENKAVDIFNLEAMKRVRGRDMVLPSRRWGKLRGEWEKIPEKTQVREGAYVMLLANRSAGTRGQFEYVNGDCGHIRGLTAHKYGGMPAVQVELVRTGSVVNVPMVVRAVDHRAKPDGFVVNEKVGEAGVPGDVYLPKQHYNTQKKRYVSGQVQYYPIRLAWATTVHKSQSLSLDKVQVDMRSWMFGQPAMAYIAMSRCRTIEGLRIVGMKEVVAEKCKSDPRVSRWL